MVHRITAVLGPTISRSLDPAPRSQDACARLAAPAFLEHAAGLSLSLLDLPNGKEVLRSSVGIEKVPPA